jgi:hypothetical protein
MTNQNEVLAAYHAHPEWTSYDIARALRCTSGYVRATIGRNKLPPRKVQRKAVEKPPEPPKADPNDQRDIDILCDLADGHSITATAKHWAVPYTHVRSLDLVRRAA